MNEEQFNKAIEAAKFIESLKPKNGTIIEYKFYMDGSSSFAVVVFNSNQWKWFSSRGGEQYDTDELIMLLSNVDEAKFVR